VVTPRDRNVFLMHRTHPCYPKVAAVQELIEDPRKL
jgi:hypothetical protein